MTTSVGIYYFSGTGNTQCVATLLKKEFNQRKIHAHTIKIEDVLKGTHKLELKKYDIIGMGYPVHAFNAPKIFFEFIEKLPVGKKRVFLFKTSGDPFMDGGATTMVRNTITQKGYTVFYEQLIVMPANVLMQYDSRLIKQLYTTAEKKTEKMVDNILSGKVSLQKNSIVSRVITRIFSALEWMGTPFFGKDLRVLPSCNLCEECITHCPTQNITRKGNTITFHWNCIVCLRCIYTCPQHAITPRLYKFFVLKEYNIQKVIDNPNIKGDFVTKYTKGIYKRFYEYMVKD
ncbi:MAG: EFR1 family ferrodoxin [Candidatus Methanofastidiosia archaeon]|jgi:flavodoxin/ferredoxin